MTVRASDETPVRLQRWTGARTVTSDEIGVTQGKPGPVSLADSTSTSKMTAPTGTVSLLPLVASRLSGIVCGTLTHDRADEVPQAVTATTLTTPNRDATLTSPASQMRKDTCDGGEHG